MPIARGNRRIWPWLGLGAATILGAGQAMGRRLYAPHYPDVALHAGLTLVARPRRVLALAAHPGDLELHAGGTLFLMAKAGSTVTAATLTNQPAGGGKRQNPDEVHRREQEQAAAILGYHRLVQLDLPVQGLTEHPRLAPAVRELWEATRPQVVLAPDPVAMGALNNPDSAATGYAAVHVGAALGRAALVVGRDQVDQELRLLLYGSRRPNLLVDITESLPEKVNAVKCHRSQLRGPDRLTDSAVRRLGRQFRHDTAAYYVEGFYRVL